MSTPARSRRPRHRRPVHEPPAGTSPAARVPTSPSTHPRRRRPHGLDRRADAGQATTEYALILLAAALVGVLVIGWATAGGGAAAIARLFDAAIESVIDQI